VGSQTAVPTLEATATPEAEQAPGLEKQEQAISHETIEETFSLARKKYGRTAKALKPGEYPFLTGKDGSWEVTTKANQWTSGFFPGILWRTYEQSGDESIRKQAEAWTTPLEKQKEDTSTHDVGFQIMRSYGEAYRLTGEKEYARVIVDAAGSLAKRYDYGIGAIRSWGKRNDKNDFRVIIDNMMNLELLHTAANILQDPDSGITEAETGISPYTLQDIAYSHALVTEFAHVRKDGSVSQVAHFDQEKDELHKTTNVQGYDNKSVWSRGQAWAIYGFAMAYRDNKNADEHLYHKPEQFLATAQRAADYFIDNLPEDNVPYWDFEAPDIPNEPKDSSAAAIAAAGLLELSALLRDTNPEASDKYFDASEGILKSLLSPEYLDRNPASDALLRHGTQHKNKGLGINKKIVYGDFYLLDALEAYKQTAAAR